MRVPLHIMIKSKIVEELELLAKKQGISRSRLIENILESYLANQQTNRPKTAKEKVIHWLLTGDESVFR